MAIQLTESAREHVRKMLEQHEGSIGLRLGTRRSGCSGYAYVVDYADEIEDNDVVFETKGVTVVVDKEQLAILDGMTIDFHKTNMINKGFDFINPNVKDMCGCGESFSV